MEGNGGHLALQTGGAKSLFSWGKPTPPPETPPTEYDCGAKMDAPGVIMLRHLSVRLRRHRLTATEKLDQGRAKESAQGFLLLGEGRGFEISGQIGPRSHSPLYEIDWARQRALEIMCRRVQNRFVFRGMLAKRYGLADIANRVWKSNSRDCLCSSRLT